MDKSHAFKTVFLGDSHVGKTCLARFFVEREVLELSSNTIGFDHHVREVEVDEGIRVKVGERGGGESTCVWGKKLWTLSFSCETPCVLIIASPYGLWALQGCYCLVVNHIDNF